MDAQSSRSADRDDDPTGRPGLFDTDLEPGHAPRRDDPDLGYDVSAQAAWSEHFHAAERFYLTILQEPTD